MVGRSLAAIIGVRPDGAGRVPVDLVRAAYRASRLGPVVLVLNGVSAAQVDRALDSTVSSIGAVSGVIYCSPATVGRFLPQRRWTRSAGARREMSSSPLRHRGERIFAFGAAARGPREAKPSCPVRVPGDPPIRD
jgi:hypothetical protein